MAGKKILSLQAMMLVGVLAAGRDGGRDRGVTEASESGSSDPVVSGASGSESPAQCDLSTLLVSVTDGQDKSTSTSTLTSGTVDPTLHTHYLEMAAGHTM